jgi:hypothetical protein
VEDFGRGFIPAASTFGCLTAASTGLPLADVVNSFDGQPAV